MVQVVTASNGALPAITSAVSETRQPGVDSFTNREFLSSQAAARGI
jgi:hypothetical protein